MTYTERPWWLAGAGAFGVLLAWAALVLGAVGGDVEGLIIGFALHEGFAIGAAFLIAAAGGRFAVRRLDGQVWTRHHERVGRLEEWTVTKKIKKRDHDAVRPLITPLLDGKYPGRGWIRSAGFGRALAVVLFYVALLPLFFAIDEFITHGWSQDVPTIVFVVSWAIGLGAAGLGIFLLVAAKAAKVAGLSELRAHEKELDDAWDALLAGAQSGRNPR